MSQLSASDDIVMVEQPVAEKPAKAKPTKKRATKKVESEEEDYADSESDEPVKKKKAPAKAKAAAKGASEFGGAPVAAKLTNKEKAAKEAKEVLEEFPVALRLAGASEADYFTRRAYFLAQAGSKLAALLKHNHQLSSGSKLEQAVRCAEFELLGGLPKCPHCKHAVLKVSRERSLSAGQVFYHCTGRSEAGDAGAYVPCSFTAWAKDLPRLRWAASLEEPAAEQGDGEAGGDAGGASAAADAAADAPALGAEAEGVTDVKAGVALVEAHAAKAGLALPKDAMALKTEVAGLLTAHRGPGGAFDIAAVLAKLAAKYPKAATGRVTASALVPENDALARAFDKVAADMAAAGEEVFKTKTFKTASDAIRCWPTKIVKGAELSKGPKKVKGVGESCAKMIDHFIAHGAFAPRDK